MSDEDKLSQAVKDANKIVIIQADNPDGDSLGSAIALEQILTGLNKHAEMFCAIDMPKHLRYLTGWSRVTRDLPSDFDLSIIVDTSSLSLLEKLSDSDLNKLKSKPVVILDHHRTTATIDFASLNINRDVVATGELIYDLAKSLNWPLNQEAKDMLATSIMSDSLGLTTSNTSAHSIFVIAELVEAGVNLSRLDNLRRETFRKSPELTKYKGELLTRIETYLDDRIAMLVIPWAEIEKYSPLYNPPMLVIEDMRLIENTAIAIAIKIYDDGHMTAKIRANTGHPIAAKLAEYFGGGGHEYASGFKTTDFNIDDLKKEIISVSSQLLNDNNHENI